MAVDDGDDDDGDDDDDTILHTYIFKIEYDMRAIANDAS